MRILTFDIEEWFHLLDVQGGDECKRWEQRESRVEVSTQRILGLLDRFGFKATFFCLGWVAQRHPSLIRQIHESGHEIASHTYAHTLLYTETPQQFRDDLARSVQTLEACCGAKVRAFRAPGFSLTRANPWVFDELAAQGITIDSSIFPTARAHGGFAGFGAASPAWVERGGVRIKEFPINLARCAGIELVFSGGGYFRLLPARLARTLFRVSPYVMTYFHPRDFDAGQPLLEGLSVLRRFRSYVGIRSAFAKLEGVLQEHPFVDIDAADRSIDWATARVISVG